MAAWYPKLDALLRKYYAVDCRTYPAIYGESYVDQYVALQIQATFEREFNPAGVAMKCIPLNHLKATAPEVYASCDKIAVAPIAALLISRKKDLFKMVVGRNAIDQFVQVHNGTLDTDASLLYSATMIDENVVCARRGEHSQNIITLRGIPGVWIMSSSQEFIDANNEILAMIKALHTVDAALPQPIAEEIHAFFH